MPKFKYLFLAILLGSFVSSNNIGYSMEDNNLSKIRFDDTSKGLYYELDNLEKYIDYFINKNINNNYNNEDVNKYNKDVLNKLKEYYNKFKFYLMRNNLEEIAKYAIYISSSLIKLEGLYHNKLKTFNNDKLVLTILLSRVCNQYFVNLIADKEIHFGSGNKITYIEQKNKGIFLSYLGNKLKDNNDFSQSIDNFERTIQAFLKHSIGNTLYPRNLELLKEDWKTLRNKYFLPIIGKFDSDFHAMFSNINIIKGNNILDKNAIEDIRRHLINMCIYYINTIVFKNYIDITKVKISEN